MNKFVSAIILCSLLLLCFTSCSSPNEKEKLDEAFNIIRADADTITKLGFSVEYEEIYYELKNSGEYDDSNWLNSSFVVTVNCIYDKAVNEDWYKKCSETDTKSLNEAFYNQYATSISHGKYSNIFFSPGMLFIYKSLEDFNSDYDAIKALAELDYVTQVYIVYKFGLPRDYMAE